MTRWVGSTWFAIFLLMSQVLQGGLAASMSCANDLDLYVGSGATQEHCTGADRVAGDDSPAGQAPAHCAFCDSGGCVMLHSPALPTSYAPVAGTHERSLRAPQPRVERFRASFEKILRPPK